MIDGDDDPAANTSNSLRRKLWRFVCDQHAELDLLPVFPLTLKQLMCYALWLSDNGVNGYPSVSSYIGSAMGFQLERGFEDVRKDTPMAAAAWARFVHRFKTLVPPKSKRPPKLALSPSLLECLGLQAIMDQSYLKWRDQTCYVLLFFGAMRVGHVAPADGRARHALRWADVQLSNGIVKVFLRSTKTRAPGVTDGFWQAIAARPTGLITLDPYRMMEEWKRLSFTGDALQLVFHGSPGVHRHLTRLEFTQRLQHSLTAATTRLGVDLDNTRWSGVSFRKQAASGLWGKIPGNRVSEYLDHSTLEAARSYGHDTVQSRAVNTHLLASDFATGF